MDDIRSVFISDVHLGSSYAKPDILLEFLKSVKKQKPLFLYIVGDFIDGWKMGRGWCWTNTSTLLIKEILDFVNNGTQILVTPGNHDEFMRDFLDTFKSLNFGNIEIKEEFIHVSATGEKLLVMHGDSFDFVTRYAPWLCKLGDIGYETLIMLNHLIDKIRRVFGRTTYYSMSKAIKSKVKQAVNYVGDFEAFLVKYAEEKDCTGVIAGHIHTANLKEINGLKYMNCGDWVESYTAIIEKNDGTFELFDYYS